MWSTRPRSGWRMLGSYSRRWRKAASLRCVRYSRKTEAPTVSKRTSGLQAYLRRYGANIRLSASPVAPSDQGECNARREVFTRFGENLCLKRRTRSRTARENMDSNRRKFVTSPRLGVADASAGGAPAERLNPDDSSPDELIAPRYF